MTEQPLPALDPASRTLLDNLVRLDAGKEFAERTGNRTEVDRLTALIDLQMRTTGLTALDLEQAKSIKRHQR